MGVPNLQKGFREPGLGTNSMRYEIPSRLESSAQRIRASVAQVTQIASGDHHCSKVNATFHLRCISYWPLHAFLFSHEIHFICNAYIPLHYQYMPPHPQATYQTHHLLIFFPYDCNSFFLIFFPLNSCDTFILLFHELYLYKPNKLMVKPNTPYVIN